MVGDTNVGKTSLLRRAALNKFDDDINTTVAPNYYELTKTVNGKMINLQVYDTAGQERYAKLNNIYYHESKAVLILYSFSDLQSFIDVDKWYDDVMSVLNEDQVIVYLVANKSDILTGTNDTPVVSMENGEQKAKELNINFVYTSAKTGNNVDDLFVNVASQIDDKFSVETISIEESKIVDIEKKDDIDENKKCC